MADWGLYTALRGTDNWAQRRQDKAMNLQIMEKMAANEERKTQQQMAAEENINQYLDAISNLDVLPEDQDRIREVEKRARQNIIQGIAKNNGDLARYVSSGGISDLHEYKNSIIQSDEVKNALSNKQNMGLIVADKQKGNRWFPPVEVDLPEIGEDGKPILDEQGNPIVKRKKVNVDTQLALYKKGIIDRISYNGSEQKVKMNAMTFHGTPKDPQNPYSKDNDVTASDIVFRAMHNGASEDYARHLANEYVDTWKKTGQTWKWGNLSEMDRLKAEADLISKTAKAAKAVGGKQVTAYADEYGRALTGKGHNPTYAKADEWVNQDGSVGTKSYTTHNVSTYELDEMAAQIGLNFGEINGSETRDKDGNLIDMSDINNPKRLANSQIFSPRTGEMIDLSDGNYTVTRVDPKVHRIDGKSYLEATIYTDEETLEGSGGMKRSAASVARGVGELGRGTIREETGFDYITAGWKGLVKDLGGGGMTSDNYEVTAFIPLNDSPTARKKGTEKLQGAQWKTESDVVGTGGGGGTMREGVRAYYDQ